MIPAPAAFTRDLHVIGHIPAGWFLLKDGDNYYLDVNAAAGHGSVTIFLQLNSDEIELYQFKGILYIRRLAHIISQWYHSFLSRHRQDLEHAAQDTIMAYLSGPRPHDIAYDPEIDR